MLAPAAQADVELPVREIRAQPVRRVDGERGLAQAAGVPATTATVTAPLAVLPGPRYQAAQPLQGRGPAGEVGDVGGQLGRERAGTTTRGPPGGELRRPAIRAGGRGHGDGAAAAAAGGRGAGPRRR